MKEGEAVRLILKNLPKHPKRLNLENQNLDTVNSNSMHTHIIKIPSKVFELISLTELKLANNNLTSIPPAIQKLSNLKSLDISCNKLTSLPVELGSIKSLQVRSSYDILLHLRMPREFSFVYRTCGFPSIHYLVSWRCGISTECCWIDCVPSQRLRYWHWMSCRTYVPQKSNSSLLSRRVSFGSPRRESKRISRSGSSSSIATPKEQKNKLHKQAKSKRRLWKKEISWVVCLESNSLH